jgi:hypothetical protein
VNVKEDLISRRKKKKWIKRSDHVYMTDNNRSNEIEENIDEH